MIAPLAKYLDWWAIQFLTRMLPPALGSNPRLEEAIQFLNGPDFIPAESSPAQIKFEGPKHFHFPSPRPGNFAENNIVPGRLYRCVKRWQERPVIILLHGGGDFINHRIRFPLIARRCNRAGFNAATIELPYHFQRSPGRLSNDATLNEGPAFPFSAARRLKERNIFRMAEAMAQGVADIRALTGWLLAEGCPTVALWGYSLGGWLAGMTACRDARIASIVLTAPGVRLNFEFAKLCLQPQIRKLGKTGIAAFEALNRTPLNLTGVKPMIAVENILLMEAKHDLLVRENDVEALWQAWSQPEIWRLPHGHISWMLAPGINRRVLEWLAPRVNQRPCPQV